MQGQSGKRKGIFYSCMSSKSSWGQTFGRHAKNVTVTIWVGPWDCGRRIVVGTGNLKTPTRLRVTSLSLPPSMPAATWHSPSPDDA